MKNHDTGDEATRPDEPPGTRGSVVRVFLREVIMGRELFPFSLWLHGGKPRAVSVQSVS